MANGTVLITGATGNTGSGIALALLAGGRKVRALVRNADKAQALRDAGAEIAVADLDDPSTLTAGLFEGVDTVYLVTWNGPGSADQIHNFLGAAKAAGATPRIIRGSAFGTPKSRLIQDIQTADEEVKASGLAWTLVQPTFFMQNLMMTIPTVNEQGMVYFDWGEGKAGMVDIRDIVESAVAVINADDGRYDGQTLVLTGASSVGFEDVATALTDALGKPVQYMAVPHEMAVQSMIGMGLPEWIAQGYAELSEGFEEGFADLTTDNVRELTGHPPRGLRDFVADHKGAWAT